jgi:4-diphosphocytidyl-2-C-methyl-D-erythritol kinase
LASHTAHAKINLGLRIVGRRPDGYHEIETIFHRIGLADSLTFAPAEDVSVSADHPDVPGGEQNICYAAAVKLRAHLGNVPGVKIGITKVIPVGAGLGGGSSDAATVLRELPRFWGRSVDAHALQTIALDLGSDVPYFLGHQSALARGRGEVLEYFNLDIPYSILLCSPPIHISTAWAYQQARPSAHTAIADFREIVTTRMHDPKSLRDGLKNDFEPVVFRTYPDVKAIKQEMIDRGATYASMSGSGSSVFGFFSDEPGARNTADFFQRKMYRTSLTPPHFRLPPIG